MGLLVQRVPVGAALSQPREDLVRHDAGRHHDRQAGALVNGRDELEQAGAAVREHPRVLAHREIEEHDTRGGEVATDSDDLIRRLAVPRTLLVAGAVEAEGALVAAVGREVDEAVEEHRVAGRTRPHLPGGGEHLAGVVAAGAKQLRELGFAQDRTVKGA